MATETREYTIEVLSGNDLNAIQSLRQQALSSDVALTESDRARSDWLYARNPAGPAAVLGLRHEGSGWVGMLAIVPRRLWIANREIPSGLLCDFYVNTRHRTLAPALMLQRAAKEHQDRLGLATYAIPNARSLAIFKRLGADVIFERRRVARPLRFHAFLVRRKRPFLATFSPIAEFVVSVADASASALSPHVKAEWVTKFDNRFDELWQAVRGCGIPTGDRSQLFLQWRFSSEPLRTNLIMVLSHRKTGQLLGYIVGDIDSDQFRVRDILFRQMDGPSIGILAKAVRAIRCLGVSGIGIQVSGPPRLIQSLNRAGFRPREAEKVFIRCSLPCTPAYWHLTLADEDI